MLDKRLLVDLRIWERLTDCTAFWIDITKLRQCPLFKIAVKFVGVNELVNGVVLDPFVHPRINDIGLVIILPADTFLGQRLLRRQQWPC